MLRIDSLTILTGTIRHQEGVDEGTLLTRTGLKTVPETLHTPYQITPAQHLSSTDAVQHRFLPNYNSRDPPRP